MCIAMYRCRISTRMDMTICTTTTSTHVGQLRRDTFTGMTMIPMSMPTSTGLICTTGMAIMTVKMGHRAIQNHNRLGCMRAF